MFCILGIFSKTGKTRVSHRVKMMTRWPRDPNVKDDPNNQLTRWPSDPVPCLIHTAVWRYTHVEFRVMGDRLSRVRVRVIKVRWRSLSRIPIRTRLPKTTADQLCLQVVKESLLSCATPGISIIWPDIMFHRHLFLRTPDPSRKVLWSRRGPVYKMSYDNL